METPRISLDLEQQNAVELVAAGHNVLITGKSGTGKSTVLKKLPEILPGDTECHRDPAALPATESGPSPTWNREPR